MTTQQYEQDGKVISDQTVHDLADEAEAGYAPESLRRTGGRRPMGSAAARIVPVRLEPELDEALQQRAAADHSTASAVVRDALRAWLTPA